jgi:hypothetical protein
MPIGSRLIHKMMLRRLEARLIPERLLRNLKGELQQRCFHWATFPSRLSDLSHDMASYKPLPARTSGGRPSMRNESKSRWTIARRGNSTRAISLI